MAGQQPLAQSFPGEPPDFLLYFPDVNTDNMHCLASWTTEKEVMNVNQTFQVGSAQPTSPIVELVPWVAHSNMIPMAIPITMQ